MFQLKIFDMKAWHCLSVEPAYFLYNVAAFIGDFANTNLVLQKSCRLNNTFEPNLDTPCDDEKKGIVTVTDVHSFYLFPSYFVTYAFVILATAWSDKAGKRRKFFIIWPILVKLVKTAILCLPAYYWHWTEMICIWCEVISHWLGGNTTMYVFGVLYICDVSAHENRTMRISILSALLNLSRVISSAVCGYMLHYLGFLYTYLVCLVITLLALILACLGVEDISIPAQKVTVWDAFDFRFIFSSFKVILRKRSDFGRLIILLMYVVCALDWFAYTGEKSVFYLYLRYRFGWNEREYSVYHLYQTVGIILGTTFSSVVLSKLLKIQDGILGTFAAFWDTVAVLCYFFASNRWHLYLTSKIQEYSHILVCIIPLLDIFHGIALNVCDSIQSKLFESEELGRVFSVRTMINIFLLFSIPAYNILFKSTMDEMPGAFFLLSVPINLIVCILYGVSYFLIRASSSHLNK